MNSGLLVLVWAFTSVVSLSNEPPGDAGQAATEGLDELLTEYRSHGLPFPPDDAKLVMRERDDGTTNGVRQFHFELTFLIGPGKKPGTAVYWLGGEPVTLDCKRPDVDAEPAAETVAKTRAAELDYRWKGFTTIPDLALAIQCKARGWDELANALLERSRGPAGSRPFDQRPRRPRDDRQALAALAWNYWCNQFAKMKDERATAVNHLRRLLDGEYGLDTKVNRNIVTDMEETLAKRYPAPGSLEAAVESLLELDVEGQWPGCGYQFFNNYADRNPNFRKLRDAGLEAVPTLINHMHDFRLTRCIESSSGGRYTWHVRMADVVAVLLNGLNPESFAYDFRMLEGRGTSLDEAHVMHWWTETQGTKALDYLLKNAVTPDSRGKRQANEGVLRALGQRYPDELVKVFEEQIEKVEHVYAMFEALADSKASDEQKARLFLAAAKSEDPWKRDFALRNLLSMKHSEAVPLLVRELKNLPHTPKVPYWESDAGRFAQLVNDTDDDRAWEAFEKTGKRVDIGQRLEMIQAIANCSERQRDRVVTTLTKFLEDEEVRTLQREPQIRQGEDPSKAFERMRSDLFFGPCAGFIFQRLAVRDFAALQIAHKLGLVVDENSTWNEDDWTKLRDRVRAALSARDTERGAKKD